MQSPIFSIGNTEEDPPYGPGPLLEDLHMNALPLVVASVLSIGVAVGAVYMFPPPQAASAPGDSGDLEVATNADTLSRLERIEARLEDLLAQPIEASAPVRTSLDPKQIEDAVAAYFARRGEASADDAAANARGEGSDEAPKKRSPAASGRCSRTAT